MAGICDFSAYFPWRRLSRSAVVEAHRWLNPSLAANARGTRSMAAWDEDSVTLAVDAARLALGDTNRADIEAINFASTTPPFADRQNAAIVAGALALSNDIASMDVTGSQRAASTALMSALNSAISGSAVKTLVVAADRRRSPAASTQELQFGDAGAAFVACRGDGIARYLGGGSTTLDFVDHYRSAEREFDYQWEERWVRDVGLKKLVPAALTNTLQRLGVAAASINHFIFASTFKGIDIEIAELVGISKERVRPNLADSIGDTGVPHSLVMLAHALEDALPGQRILLATFGQGCDVLLFETTDALGSYQARSTVKLQLQAGSVESNYMRYLVFNNLLNWDKGKRAERDKQTALTTLYRNRDVIMALVGGKCRQCGTHQFPPARICVNPSCVAVDSQDPYSFAELTASIVSWSGDHLVFTHDPPLHYGMIAFDKGGRFLTEFADCTSADVKIGAPVRMAFRVKDFDTVRGFRRYFWKAVPARLPNRPAGE
jgi:3-hydroxy-3-methylglutaryl CoA synthase